MVAPLWVVEFVKSLPTILAALIQLKKWWDQEFEVRERREAMREFTEALKHAHETKDTTPLEHFFYTLSTDKRLRSRDN